MPFVGAFVKYLKPMELLLEKQLQAARSERKAVMGEFLRLKAELATAERNDDLRAENLALKKALHRRARSHQFVLLRNPTEDDASS